MIPIFNEHDYAVKMNNGYAKDREQDEKRKYNYRELLIYTKWLYWNIFKDHSSDDRLFLTHRTLISFCRQLLLNFNEDLDYRMIENLVHHASHEKLRTNYSIYISKNEQSQILRLPTEESRRLYLAMLIVAKYNRNNPIETTEERPAYSYSDTRLRLSRIITYDELRKYANIKLLKAQRDCDVYAYERPLMDLKKMGLIEEYIAFGARKYNRFKAGVILSQADIMIPQENIAIEITHCANFEAYFHYLLGDPGYRICPKCGNAFKKSSNKSKYCNECTCQLFPKAYKVCTNCGRRFEVSNRDTRTEYCDKCHKKMLKDIKHQWDLEHRSKISERPS